MTKNIDNSSRALNKQFVYQESIWRVLLLNGFLIAGLITFLSSILSSNLKSFTWILAFKSTLLIGVLVVLVRILYSAFINRNNYLQITADKDEFYFGYDKEKTKSYHKKDVENITVYAPSTSRSLVLIEVFEIKFKDGSSIKFSNMLISSSTLFNKFNNEASGTYVSRLKGDINVLKIL